jgi:hypothetical protein
MNGRVRMDKNLNAEEEVVAELSRRLKALEGTKLDRSVEGKVNAIINDMIDERFLGPGFLQEMGISVTLDKATSAIGITFYDKE